ncbi:carbohydrate kinase family protein [Microlunatus spumicola]|uniref:Carbohydrate kinase family protein n=1 Tax=Microlunatus spumicola TaxID=81499 RepID=A0ABP6WUG2_9ACTN
MSAARLVLVGGVLVDVVLYVPHVPAAGGDVLASDASVTTGGGFNVLAAARRQGLAVTYLGRHGTGRFGDQARADLAAEGITVGQPVSTEGDTGFCVGLVDADAERTYATHTGVEGGLTRAHLDGLALEPDDALWLSGYDLAYPHGPLVVPWFAGLPAHHRTFFDPGPVVAGLDPAMLKAVLGRADWVSLNVAEARTLTGCPDAGSSARHWSRALPLPRAGVVVRDGAAGCWVVEADRPAEVRHVPVPLGPVTARDTSGAGDCHLGTFAAALARGEEPTAAARWANAAAALSVQRVGSATGPTYAEVATALGCGRAG